MELKCNNNNNQLFKLRLDGLSMMSFPCYQICCHPTTLIIIIKLHIPRTCRWCKQSLRKRSLAVFAIHTCMFDIRKRKLYSGFIPYLAHLCGQNFLSFKIVFSSQDLPPARPVFCVCGRGFAFASAVSASAIDMLLWA